jgi:hypothetical protein
LRKTCRGYRCAGWTKTSSIDRCTTPDTKSTFIADRTVIPVQSQTEDWFKEAGVLPNIGWQIDFLGIDPYTLEAIAVVEWSTPMTESTARKAHINIFRSPSARDLEEVR